MIIASSTDVEKFIRLFQVSDLPFFLFYLMLLSPRIQVANYLVVLRMITNLTMADESQYGFFI